MSLWSTSENWYLDYGPYFEQKEFHSRGHATVYGRYPKRVRVSEYCHRVVHDEAPVDVTGYFRNSRANVDHIVRVLTDDYRLRHEAELKPDAVHNWYNQYLRHHRLADTITHAETSHESGGSIGATSNRF